MTVEIVDAPARLIKVTYECNVDDYVFRWKWSYLWQWRRCYNRWYFCREMNKTIERLADEMRQEIDAQIIKTICGENDENQQTFQPQ